MNRYRNYRDTGVAWIGKIPDSWKLIRGRFLFKFQKEINAGLKNENLLSLTLFGVLNKEYYSSEGLRPETYSTYQIFQKNDLVFKMIDLENVNTSRVGLVHETGIMSPVYIRHEPKTEKIDPKFSYWFYLDLYKKEIYNSIGSGVRSSLNSSDLLELEVPVPTLKEQKIISRYLDKKTGQIDALIEKMQKKIELLKEKRISLISQCVTKGLNPNVQMKDSGVEWIGKIPKHWEITRLKHLAKDGVQYGLNIASESYTENGVRFLRVTDINSDGHLKDENGVYLKSLEVPKEYYLRAGDVLLSRSGTVGKSILINDSKHPMSFAGYLVRFSFDNYQTATFIKRVTESSIYWRWIDMQAIQSTIQNVNGEKYSNFILPLPNSDEIKKITDHLEEKIKVIDRVAELHREKVIKLVEYRQSLISSIVTGKIRVTEEMI